MTALETITLTVNEEYKNIYPPLTDEEFNEIKESIKNNRQQVPIITNEQGVIVDGYHRWKICRELGIEPWYITIPFKDQAEEIECIIDCNKRRHLNKFQRTESALKAKECLKRIAKENSSANLKQNQQDPSVRNQTVDSYPSEECTANGRGRVNQKIGNKANVGKDTVYKVETILREAREELKEKARKGQLSINKVYNEVNKEKERQKRYTTAAQLPKLPGGAKIVHGDFRDKCKEIADNSIPLLPTDPPYDEASLPLYKDLGREAMRVLVDGGCLATYVGEGYQDIAIQYLKESGLKFWNTVTVKLAGNHSEIHYRKMFVYCKTILLFVKGDKLREGIPNGGYIPNYVESTKPEKLLHGKGWEQSTTEAEHVIKYLTFPNETILDCMCGAGTTGIAALRLRRQFLGIDIDENECKNADINIRRMELQQKIFETFTTTRRENERKEPLT
jgi:ParB-like chromosome segregation protein Spo0J